MIPLLQVSAAPEVLAGNIPEVSAVSFCSEHYHLWVSYLSICNYNIAKIDHLSIILFGCTCKGRVLATLYCLSVCITSAKHKKSNRILRREPDVCREPSVAQNVFQWTLTKSAKGCCRELLGNQRRCVLQSKSIFKPFYTLF